MKRRQTNRKRTYWWFFIVLLVTGAVMLPGAVLLAEGEGDSTKRVTESTPDPATAHPPRSDDVLHLPPASYLTAHAKRRALIKEWTRRARLRIGSMTAARVEEPESPVELALKKRIPIHFENEPLSDVLDAIAKSAGLKIVIDERGIREEGVTVDTPVTIKLNSPISARSALNHILMPKALVYHVDGDTVRVTGETKRLTKVFTRTYEIADLASHACVELSLDDQNHDPPEQTRLDDEFLIDLITSTITPLTWRDARGSGSIAGDPANSSLIVSADLETHDEIVDLLEQLRRLQDLRAKLKLEIIRVAPGETVVFDAVETDPPMEPVDLMASLSSEPATLSNIETEILRRFFQSREKMEVVAGPEVTLLNGQTARIEHPKANMDAGSEAIYLRPVVSPDRQAVRLAAAVSDQEPDAWEIQAFRSTVADGGGLLIDITDKTTSRGPGLQQDKPSDSGARVLLLVMPQVVFIEEHPGPPIPPPP